MAWHEPAVYEPRPLTYPLLQRVAHLILVAINVRAVDQSIATVNGALHSSLDLTWLALPRAQTNKGNLFSSEKLRVRLLRHI